mmetsp:Transcript_19176/g.27302  ORF Transcript_19176/g.27302 Transcript_19176/m.27302 type:complete len:304 (-) Transcript_19176:1177-2088(-)
MSRFSDEWVIDRTMFDFTQGGSCNCCGLPHLFNTGGIKGLIDACTDLETDAAALELNAMEKSPWPPQMREEVWGDRVKLRLKMKREMKKYKSFFENHNAKNVQEWCLNTLGVDGLRRIFQMPRSEIKHIIETNYGICSAYSIVLCTVTEQVANFAQTKYQSDACSDEEMDFEDMLYSDRRAGFMLVMKEEIKDVVVEAFVQYMVRLGGPKLLMRRHRPASDDSDSDRGDDNNDDDVGGKGVASSQATASAKEGPSFRSDRRIVRLLIGRYWADRIINKYTNFMTSQNEIVKNSEVEAKEEAVR